MKEHSYLDKFGDNDVLEFKEQNLIKLGKIRDSIRNFLGSNLENSLRDFLSNVGINIPGKTTDFSANLYGKLLETMGMKVTEQLPDEQLLGAGVSCKILKLGSTNWQKGKLKLRVSLEFEPDEPEIPSSPLDDIRKEMNQP
jgi:hypothetical protein